MKIAIIGAGISGVSIGQLLHNDHHVDIYERRNKPGGLIRCERINNNLFHKVGGHVFNSKNDNVLNWFWSFFDKKNEFLKTNRNAKILLNGEVIGYPIENHLYKFRYETIEKIISEILTLNAKTNKTDCSNFQDFLIENFGESLFKLYFKPYNEKIWRTNLDAIPLNWLNGKLPMPNYKEIILKNILRSKETEMVHSQFYYPKNGGSQFIIDRLSKGLNIKLNYNIKSLSKNNNQFQLNDDKCYDHVIYTGDIRKLSSILNIKNSPLKKFDSELSKLKTNGTSNIFCECDHNDISWLYLPDKEILAHRIIFTGNFSKSNNLGTNRNTCVVEFSGIVPEKLMKSQITKLPGNLSPISINHEYDSYIIHNDSTTELISSVRNELKKIGISLLGRFAEWEYYNMDACIESGMKLKEELQKTNG